MTEPVTINPAPSADPGLDFGRLKEEGVALVQELAGRVWTDYNESDPGVTTLEQLCYALTELSYRSTLPLADLLADERGRVEPHRQGMFVARRILPCNPVTPTDYRKLLLDRVPDLGNVWMVPRLPPRGDGEDAATGATEAGTGAPARAETGAGEPGPAGRHRRRAPTNVPGLYDVYLYAPGLPAPECDPEVGDGRGVAERVRRVYARHRDLCEDLGDLRILTPVRTVVRAVATVRDERTPEEILARLLFRVGDLLAPEPGRRPLGALVAEGVPPAEIFEGPLLLNGFFRDDDLDPKAPAVSVQQVVRALVSAPGVTSARDVSVTYRGETFRGDDWFDVGETEIPDLVTTPVDGEFSVRLVRNGVTLQPSPARVRRELDRLWQERRRTWPLSAEYGELFSVPTGTYHDLARYFSVQEQYPGVYGIGSYGLPSTATTARRGQARQLKGYLLPFEQLLADFFAQLARVRDLFSLERDLEHTYFFQYLDGSVPDVEPLLKKGGDGEPGYHRGLPELVHDADPAVARRNRFLAFLLALYAERLDADSISEHSARGWDADGPGERLLHARLALLHRLVEATHDRGRGFDTLAPPSPANEAGMAIKSRIQLGLEPYDPRPLHQALDEVGVELAESGGATGGSLDHHAEHIEAEMIPAAVLLEDAAGDGGEEGGGASSRRPASALGVRRVPEDILGAAADAGGLRVGSLPGEGAVSVVGRTSRGSWRLLGRYPDTDSAAEGCRDLAEVLRHLHRHHRQLYLVEHNLLRRRTEDRPSGDDEAAAATPASGYGMFGVDAGSTGLATQGGSGERSGGEGGEAAGAEPTAEEAVDGSVHAGFSWAFTVTAVLCVPEPLRDDGDYRTFAAEVLRANAPAHVVVRTCFLGPWHTVRFEHLYWDWRSALRQGSARRINAASRGLRHFLAHHCRGGRHRS